MQSLGQKYIIIQEPWEGGASKLLPFPQKNFFKGFPRGYKILPPVILRKNTKILIIFVKIFFQIFVHFGYPWDLHKSVNFFSKFCHILQYFLNRNLANNFWLIPSRIYYYKFFWQNMVVLPNLIGILRIFQLGHWGAETLTIFITKLSFWRWELLKNDDSGLPSTSSKINSKNTFFSNFMWNVYK